jgi:choice-of-anchor C domain-containing protein
MRIFLALLAGGLVTWSVPAAAVNLLTNGSFELGTDPGEAVELPMGSTALPGWVVTRNPIDYVGTRWNAAEGVRSLALNGTNPGGIAQSFATVPGQPYTVRFFMAGDAFSSPILKHMRVSAAGQSQDYEFDAGHSWPWGMGWFEHSLVFTANASSTTLEFESLDAGTTGPTLDSVVVTGQSPVGVPIVPPAGLALAAPSPNPAREGFEIAYTVPTAMSLRLSVIDVRGRELHVLAEGVHPAGPYARGWNRRTEHGQAPAGLYFIRLDAPGRSIVRKLVLL